MEKSLCLVAVVAFSCGGLPSASAQIQLQGAAHSIQLVNQSSDDQAPEVDDNSSEIANPFDFFQVDLDSSNELSAPSQTKQQNRNAPAAPSQTTNRDRSPSESDPAALPIAKQQRSIVDTIVDQSMVASLPHAAYVPVQWSGTVPTPNPIASLLLRGECNSEALWVGYHEQRARECQQMWEHLARHSNRHGHGGCGHAGCGQAAACGQSGCGSCGHAPVRNRYLTEAPAPACDAGAAVGNAPAHFNAPAIQVPTVAPHIAPVTNSSAENDNAPPPPQGSKVASLPMFHR